MAFVQIILNLEMKYFHTIQIFNGTTPEWYKSKCCYNKISIIKVGLWCLMPLSTIFPVPSH